MPDQNIIHDRLNLILESINLILERSTRIKTAKDFVKNKEGIELMDSIAMRLQMMLKIQNELLKRKKTFLNQNCTLIPILLFASVISSPIIMKKRITRSFLIFAPIIYL